MNEITRLLSKMTGFNEFDVGGVCGLWRVGGKFTDILAIAADEPGKGQCRQFLDRLLANCDRVRFLHVESQILHDALLRRGFVDAEWFHDGEKVAGMVWRRTP